MKIVFVGNHEVDYSSETHHVKSLESLGHEVIKLQEGKVNIDQIMDACIGSDLLVFIHTHGWDTEHVERLKLLNIPVISYHLDLWLGIEREKDLLNDPVYSIYDDWFVTDKLMVDWLDKNTSTKGHFIPAGVYDKECYITDESHSKSNDVIFVGSRGYHPEWQYRPQLIDWLRSTYKDRFTHVGGDGDTGTIRGHELNKMYASSKVAIGDTLCINFDYPYYISDRLFESTGRGGFTIFPYIKGINEFFKVGEEIVCYDYGNFDQLKELVDYYCEHDDERESIRRAGHERTKKDHTYIERWRQILNTLFDKE